MDDVSAAQRELWTLGYYPTIARHLMPIAVATIDALGIRPGERVLDVGTGTGNAAVEAARRGAVVSGVDLTPRQIEFARKRCEVEEVSVELSVGDAQELGWADGAFDAVVSVMAVALAPDHARAAAEMVRVARPGGRIAMTWWSSGGWSAAWRERLADLMPPPSPDGPMPDEWSDPGEFARRLRAAGLGDVSVTERPFAWRFASIDEGMETFVTGAGPYVRTMAVADDLGRGDEARATFRAALEEANVADDGSLVLPGPYLLGIGVKE